MTHLLRGVRRHQLRRGGTVRALRKSGDSSGQLSSTPVLTLCTGLRLAPTTCRKATAQVSSRSKARTLAHIRRPHLVHGSQQVACGAHGMSRGPQTGAPTGLSRSQAYHRQAFGCVELSTVGMIPAQPCAKAAQTTDSCTLPRVRCVLAAKRTVRVLGMPNTFRQVASLGQRRTFGPYPV